MTIYTGIKVERAKSGRSYCRSCHNTIKKGEPRVGIMDSRFRSYEWFCKRCGKQFLREALAELEKFALEDESIDITKIEHEVH